MISTISLYPNKFCEHNTSTDVTIESLFLQSDDDEIPTREYA